MFRLLMEGHHPYDGRYRGTGNSVPTIDQRIVAGHSPYTGQRIPWEPKPGAPPFEILHPDVRRLMVQCFLEGHTNPKKRPSTEQLLQGLKKSELSLVSCNVNECHWFGSHLSRCPWCERKTLLGGLDPFPRPGSPLPQRRKSPAQKAVHRTSSLSTIYRHQTTRRALATPYRVVQFVQLRQGSRSNPHVGFIIFLIIIGLLVLVSRICSRASECPSPHTAGDHNRTVVARIGGFASDTTKIANDLSEFCSGFLSKADPVDTKKQE